MPKIGESLDDYLKNRVILKASLETKIYVTYFTSNFKLISGRFHISLFFILPYFFL